ncbi:MAG: glycosyl transferase family 2, partial [Muribaculaceae bacterium]|nr:glycosyl transferase family 2 [Muribaculaceae bacterium]
RHAGFTIGLMRDAYVWHKRRVDFRRYFRQVYVFGMSRVTLRLLYPDSLKAVHLLPAVFVLGTLTLLLLGVIVSPWWLLPLGVYFAAVFACAWYSTKSLKIALLAVPAAIIQLGGYGLGFIKAFFIKIILRRGRNVEEEIELRRGK